MRTQEPAVVTIAESARRLGITPNGLRYWIRRGHIETVATPLGRVVLAESLRAFIASREVGQTEIGVADDRD